MDSILIDTAQAARLLRVAPTTLRKWRVSGKGPRYVRLSKVRVFYRREDIEAWVEARTFASTSEETVAAEKADQEAHDG